MFLVAFCQRIASGFLHSWVDTQFLPTCLNLAMFQLIIIILARQSESSIRRHQRQHPVWVWSGMCFFLQFFKRTGRCSPKLKQYHPSPHTTGSSCSPSSPPAIALHSCVLKDAVTTSPNIVIHQLFSLLYSFKELKYHISISFPSVPLTKTSAGLILWVSEPILLYLLLSPHFSTSSFAAPHSGWSLIFVPSGLLFFFIYNSPLENHPSFCPILNL